MFKQTISGYNIPVPGTVERLEARPATRGGGWILDLVIGGKAETMVFPSAETLTQTMTAMLNSAVLAQMAAAAQQKSTPDNPTPPDVTKLQTQRITKAIPVGPGSAEPAKEIAVPTKRKGGRPKMTEEQKAAAKAAREAKKNANIPPEEGQEAA